MSKRLAKEGPLQALELELDQNIQEPPMFKVLLYNDDYTTMEFVVKVLMEIFNKSQQEATNIMLRIHNEGSGVCGLYPKELAETKVEMVHALAAANGFPLLASCEEA
ncbi:MAG: ATP-dependent Clp protease adapter ClpS [Dissulfurimicrobium sp.]|uniref:ATP-dependent Clp protease adapter ClpS n=1 Tax=Dissulfurimicrobium TaxID=1769732 RepID=UPI001EDBDD93|nr:ATP-dependent Clp protease adapter ClpS [Dissulfurimicrobium hydrothermale]UKL12942.1 ATP-dependent Clp protease adapter ClpS [Dissulfurimicrobium hydrothermale]